MVLQLGSPGPVPLELAPNEKYTLEACVEAELLSMTNPLVAPAVFEGAAAECVTAEGGNVNGGVTLMDMMQPLCPTVPPLIDVRQVLPPFIGAPLLALFPMLKKIQSVDVVVL